MTDPKIFYLARFSAPTPAHVLASRLAPNVLASHWQSLFVQLQRPSRRSRQAHQRAAAQQQQIQANQLKAAIQAEDDAFDKRIAATETPETIRRVKDSVGEIAQKHYGLSREDLAHLWRTQPLMHTAAFQQMMFDATRYRMAQSEVANKVDRSVPPVQKPGISQPHKASDGQVEAALKKFNADPNPKNAADLLMARRAARK